MKKLLFVALPLVLAAGVTGGLAFVGILQIPGITPKRKVVVVAATPRPIGGFLWHLVTPAQRLGDELAAAARREKVAKRPVAKKDNAPEGERRLASLWNELDADRLAELTAKWPERRLARILLRMEEEQVRAVLTALKPTRASALSAALQAEAAADPTLKPGA